MSMLSHPDGLSHSPFVVCACYLSMSSFFFVMTDSSDNPVDHFPVYEPSAERLAAIAEAASESANPIETHYNASHEVRAKGAAFYAFSSDEQKRQQELAELQKARMETEKAREEAGAINVKAGEVEGMVASGSGGGEPVSGVIMSRAVEKRKREIEERRRLLEEKRRRLRGSDPEVKDAREPKADAQGPNMVAPSDETKVVSPLSLPEEETRSPAPRSTANHDDPFARLEAQAHSSTPTASGASSTRKRKPKKQWDDGPKNLGTADAFLKDLENDLVGRR